MSDLPEPVPAATLILMRPALQGPPDLLMIERAANMAFAAGALVFPGGRIDPDDHRTAVLLGSGHEDAAARVAAIRETIEETGIIAATSAGSDRLRGLREELASGALFSEALERRGISLDLDALTSFARWCPNFRETRRFDTYFYIAEPPAESATESADETEAARAFWASAAETLAEIGAGRAHAIFPTRRNLERLARFGSVAEARADAARFPVARITPWIEDRDGEKWLRIGDDLGYPVTAEPLATARRG